MLWSNCPSVKGRELLRLIATTGKNAGASLQQHISLHLRLDIKYSQGDPILSVPSLTVQPCIYLLKRYYCIIDQVVTLSKPNQCEIHPATHKQTPWFDIN